MKSEDFIILELGGVLTLVCIASFFLTPSYEKGAYFIMGVLATQFANVMGYKFGRSLPAQAGDQKPGQTSETTIKTETEPPPTK